MTKPKHSSKESEKVILQLVKDGRFTVNKDGTIYRNGSWRKGKQRHSAPTPVIASDNRYYVISVRIDGKYYYARAHRIVWKWFNGDIPKGYCLWHINRDRKDNRLSNLKLIPIYDALVGKTPESSREQALEVRHLYEEGESPAYIADKTGLGIRHVHAIVTGKTWRRLEAEAPITRKPGNRAEMPPNWKERRVILKRESSQKVLTKREYQVMKYRYFDLLTLVAIGKKYGLTKQRISVICKRAEEKLNS